MVYQLRWRRPGRPVVSLGPDEGLPQDLGEVLRHAEVYCENNDTDVVVMRDNTLICVVKPDPKPVTRVVTAPEVV